MHVSEIIAETLGSDFYSAQNKYFDYIEACDRLALYNYIDIPKIKKEDVPEHVTEVRFSSDLTHLKDIRDGVYDKGTGDLYNSLF